MANEKKPNQVNMKFDNETKMKLEALKYLTGESLNRLCEIAVIEYLDKHSKEIDTVMKAKQQVK